MNLGFYLNLGFRIFDFMKLDLSLNPQKETGQIVTFIRKKVQNTPFSKVVVGLSGGVDSAVSTALAVRALGKENVHVGIFPYGELHTEGEQDAVLVTDHLNISQSNIHTIDIKNMVDAIGPDLAVLGSTLTEFDQLRKGNIAVRTRMILLFDLAKKLSALVLGTENKTEHLLGYFTRFGDEASDIEPVRTFYKTQVKQLAQYLQLPQKIIAKAPTAGMWKGQTDEGEFGFSYKDADQILYLYFDKKLKKSEIEKEGFRIELIHKILERVEKNKFKHELPYILNESYK